jgi:hypothetical protein
MRDYYTLGLDPSSTNFGYGVLKNGEYETSGVIKQTSDIPYFKRYLNILQELESIVGEREWYSTAIEAPPPTGQVSALLYAFYFSLLDLFRRSGKTPNTFAMLPLSLKSAISKTCEFTTRELSKKPNVKKAGIDHFKINKKITDHELEACFLAEASFSFQKYLDDPSYKIPLQWEEKFLNEKMRYKKIKRKGVVTKKELGKTGILYRTDEFYFNWDEYQNYTVW